MRRVDTILSWCEVYKLAVIITIHHFNELYDHPDDAEQLGKFHSIWEQLSVHYSGIGYDSLFFEPLNEPHNNLTPEKWNALLPDILETIRNIDRKRTLILDVPEYGYHGALGKLHIPDSEKNSIVSVRYYLPYDFTHQGAHWASGSNDWLGITWKGTEEERAIVNEDIKKIKSWSEENMRPITIGEFGSIIYADAGSRLAWTTYVSSAFRNAGFSWSYFDFGVLFAAYNIQSEAWLPGFLEALIN